MFEKGSYNRDHRRPGDRSKKNGIGRYSIIGVGVATLMVSSAAFASTNDTPADGATLAKPKRVTHASTTHRRKAPAAVFATAPVPAAPPPMSPAQAELAKLASFDALNEKGWEIPNPSVADSVLGDAGGFRSALAGHGIGFTFFSLNSFSANILSNTPGGVQVYSGQRPTLTTANFFTLNYDLGRLGDTGAQFVIGGNIDSDTWRPLGPPGARFARLHIYQPFFNDRISVKAGFMENDLEFVGLSVGGSLVGGTLGINSILPFQAGLARLGLLAPAVNVRTKITDDIYYKVGLQRSTNPAGADADRVANPIGLTFTEPKAGLLVINEVGYKKDAAPSVNAIWLRAGGIYNNSDYFNYRTFTTNSKNSMEYVAADYQLKSFGGPFSFQGIYAGASFMVAPPQENLFQRYYEGRLYGFGLFPGRPFDLTNFVVTHTDFSNDVRSFLMQSAGANTYPGTTSFTLSHAYRVMSGVYASPAISYTIHPSATTLAPNALSLLLNLNLIL